MFGEHDDEEAGHPTSYVHKPRVPPVVQAAFHFIQISNQSNANMFGDPGDAPKAARKKGDAEAMALEAAYMVIRHYLTGEMVYDCEPLIYDLTTGQPNKEAPSRARVGK